MPGAMVDIPPLTGMIMPGRADGVVLFQIPECQDYFVPLFTSEQMLRTTLAKAGIAFSILKQVEDGPSFLDNLPLLYNGQRIRVMVDPEIDPRDERFRFFEVLRANPMIA